jgi:hypothetical protein
VVVSGPDAVGAGVLGVGPGPAVGPTLAVGPTAVGAAGVGVTPVGATPPEAPVGPMGLGAMGPVTLGVGATGPEGPGVGTLGCDGSTVSVVPSVSAGSPQLANNTREVTHSEMRRGLGLRMKFLDGKGRERGTKLTKRAQ